MNSKKLYKTMKKTKKKNESYSVCLMKKKKKLENVKGKRSWNNKINEFSYVFRAVKNRPKRNKNEREKRTKSYTISAG